jgi:2-C-methyl-D-erythritol 4-phosphate cytidylyltransferase
VTAVKTEPTRLWAVVPAAGKGSRMGADRPKQYLELAGRTVLEHTLRRLLAEPRIAAIVVALAAEDADGPRVIASLGPRVRATSGGAERCHSVLNGLDALPEAAADDWVLVHDAARPCLRQADLAKLIDDLSGGDCGGILAVPVRDTLKRCAADGSIEHTVDRASLWHALTPQMFRLGILREALRAALAAGRLVTDEAQAVELAGRVPRVVEGHADNIKITRPEDLPLAEHYLKTQPGE